MFVCNFCREHLRQIVGCLQPPKKVSSGVPRSGIASDTCGRVSVTMLWKTVRERRIVTPEKIRKLIDVISSTVFKLRRAA